MKQKNDEILTELYKYLANLLVVRYAMYGVHWHVKGVGYLDIHHFTKKAIPKFTKRYDEIADRIIQLKGLLSNDPQKQLTKATLTLIEHSSINARDGWQTIKYYLRQIHKEINHLYEKVLVSKDWGTLVILNKNLEMINRLLVEAKNSCPCNELPSTLEAKINLLYQAKRK